ncbi:MAG TPA: entericidin A/B family lipoprotein [Aliidongia sp.]|uniref:entericidin A/B family lipoprotein n=1 Tax=Aliidongia sp. TaxID=1914230 RepID=UPI002DDD1223|nr:entericidin A/B family lipoprotein [Aliidongia sp.]HEV2678254.1 entericidin A/B family lipoprotein [Aliidongia sp.]
MRSTLKDRAAKALLTLVLLGSLGSTLAACNTTAGAGQDISNTGHVITKAADKNMPQ